MRSVEIAEDERQRVGRREPRDLAVETGDSSLSQVRAEAGSWGQEAFKPPCDWHQSSGGAASVQAGPGREIIADTSGVNQRRDGAQRGISVLVKDGAQVRVGGLAMQRVQLDNACAHRACVVSREGLQLRRPEGLHTERDACEADGRGLVMKSGTSAHLGA